LSLMFTLASPNAAGAASGTPFAGTDVLRLVLQTPVVTRNPAKSADDRIWVDLENSKLGGAVRSDLATSGKTIDDDWLLAVPLDQSGLLGVHAALVYRWTGSGAAFVGSVDAKGGGLTVAVRDGHLFASVPLYGKRDSLCCPGARMVKRILYSPTVEGLIEVTSEKVDLTRAPAAAASRSPAHANPSPS
ncbi:MAG: hypothetical protein GIW95_09500, partial [Candidatus Eremiobacteraeota bacterium]|nr:hypothetical protein [Candidatus Eremiobacteraeota bacterium]